MAKGTRNLLTVVYAGAVAGRRPRLQATRATAIVMRGEERAALTLVRSAATPVVEARRSMDHTHQGEVWREVRGRVEGKAMAVAGRAWVGGLGARGWRRRGRRGGEEGLLGRTRREEEGMAGTRA